MRLRLGAQLAALAVVLGLLGLLVWKIVNQEKSTIPQQVAQNKHPVAPAFELPRLDRPGTMSLASLKGKAVVLNFWASWCAPCRDESGDLERAWDRYRGQGVVVLGVDQQDLSSDARAFAKKYGMTYPL
ncbi:MAG: TlpA family protein disulfide reductase, partial [Actinobacteria bacterium]|nr:TlpA family protein disulfide reductase [Actinomycetota bacterium]